jgi:hypothetical protein
MAKGQTISWPEEKREKYKQYNDQRKNEKRTNNIMGKGKRQNDKQYNVVCSFVVFPLAIILFVLLSSSIGHYIVCHFVVFPLAIILFVVLSFSFGHYIVCPFVVFLWL